MDDRPLIEKSLPEMTDRELDYVVKTDSRPAVAQMIAQERRWRAERLAKQAEAAAERARAETQRDVGERLRQAEIKLAAARQAHEAHVVTRTAGETAELAKRLAELESRASVAYRGVWTMGTRYAPGDCVTDHGSLFICRVATAGVIRPGDPAVWTLAVKRGQDGKDLRDAR